MNDNDRAQSHRATQIKFLTNPTEQETIMAAAERAGLPAAAYARQIVLRQARKDLAEED